jgi:hypothetical protein
MLFVVLCGLPGLRQICSSVPSRPLAKLTSGFRLMEART